MKTQVRIFILSLAIFSLSMSSVFADEKFVISAPKEVEVGESFNVSIFVSSPYQSMNAVSGLIKFSNAVNISKINKNPSIINFWTNEPKILSNKISFEGVALNPGYQGDRGSLFNFVLTAKNQGITTISFSEGAILANDGLGSNLIDLLSSVSINVRAPSGVKVDTIPGRPIAIINTNQNGKIVALPVITDYPEYINDTSRAHIKGKGEPNALTKLTFKDISVKSLGEQFVASLQSKKNKPSEALVKNDKEGYFEYLSVGNLVAGAYNVTPFLVDQEQQIEKPGFGAKIFVNNSKVVKWLVVFINILALLIPIICLLIIIYFIPWYSRLRMKILNHKIQLEDERLNLSEKEIKKKEDSIT